MHQSRIAEYTLDKEPGRSIDLIINFKTYVHQSIFLFDDKTGKYLLNVLNLAEKINSLKCREQDYIEELEWFEKQKVEVRDTFKRFMKFEF